MADVSYPTFPIFAFIGFVIVLVPLPWHLQAWNSGTCLYIVWTAMACLNQFVNSVVWHGNVINHAPVWCDISTRLMIGIAVAIPSASLCINRRLYKIASVQTVSITRKDKQKAVLIDMIIGVGIPVTQMVLQYIVQGHRFDIIEDIGCYPVTYITPPAFVLVLVWPLVIGLISAIFCVLTLKAFLERRAQFSELLLTHSSLTMTRYFRLMALASADLLCTVPYSAYGIYLNLRDVPISPWKGWADTHFNFSKVGQITAVAWHTNRNVAVALELSRWVIPVCAILFFGFFGFADEAQRNYSRVFAFCVSRIPFTTSVKITTAKPKATHYYRTSASRMTASGTLPIYVSRTYQSRKNSVDSMENAIVLSP